MNFESKSLSNSIVEYVKGYQKQKLINKQHEFKLKKISLINDKFGRVFAILIFVFRRVLFF